MLLSQELMAGLSSHLSEKFGQETGDVFAPSDGAGSAPSLLPLASTTARVPYRAPLLPRIRSADRQTKSRRLVTADRAILWEPLSGILCHLFRFSERAHVYTRQAPVCIHVSMHIDPHVRHEYAKFACACDRSRCKTETYMQRCGP